MALTDRDDRHLFALVDESSGVSAEINSSGHVKVEIAADTAGATAKTPLTKTGSASATFTVVAAVSSKRIKVYSLSLLTASTTAVTVTFKDGAAGTAIATYPLQAISGTNFGIAEGVSIPSFLFASSAGVLLEMSFSAAQSVTYNVRYFADDAA